MIVIPVLPRFERMCSLAVRGYRLARCVDVPGLVDILLRGNCMSGILSLEM